MIPLRIACALVALLPSLLAQTVTLTNYAPTTFRGWVRRNVQPKPINVAGSRDGFRYVVGRKAGRDTWHVDVWAELAPGDRVELDLATFGVDEPPGLELPADPLAFFGGPVTIGGRPMQFLELAVDGAAVTSHLLHRDGMLAVHLWSRWYPDAPAFAEAEAAVCCSNPALPAMSIDLPDLTLRFGDALVVVPGKGGAQLATGTLVDGQARVTLPRFLWTRHLKASDFETAVASMQLGVGAVAIRDLWPSGTPEQPPGFDARQWAAQRFAESLRRMHTWEDPTCGPNLVSGDTGRQETQFYHPGSEAFAFPGAEWVRLCSSLKLFGERPANHLEANGLELNLAAHPGLLMWDARPHRPISTDLLGKPRALYASEAHDRWGPDTQHWIATDLVAAARLTGSQAAQFLLGNLARDYLRQRTTNPSWSTSATFSAREWGYEGAWVLQVDDNLEDRALAAQVVANAKTRLEHLALPMLAGRDYVQAFDSDPRLGPGRWIIAWQEAWAALGFDDLAERVGSAEGRALALRIARRIMRDGWAQGAAASFSAGGGDVQLGTLGERLGGVPAAAVAFGMQPGATWLTRAQFPIDGQALPPADGSFNAYAMPCAAVVVLRHDPSDEQARDVLEQVLEAGDWRWLPPNSLPGK